MRKRKQVIWSAVIAVGFLIISYCITNLHIPISGEKAVLYKFEMYRNYLFPRSCSVPDSLLFVNVAYDKEFVEATDEYGLPVGQTQITDRQKLLQLLQELKRRNDYKYILMDIFFDEETHTSADSVLFATICSMPRIVIPRHRDGKLANEALYAKAGMADYTTTYKEAGFVKYPYLIDSVASMPLRMYEDITGRTIKHHWFLYTDGWKIVRKSVILAFDVNVNTPYNEEGEKNWYNLGADLLGNDEEKGLLYELPELTKGKYIAIGAMAEDDMHSTYLDARTGHQHGCLSGLDERTSCCLVAADADYVCGILHPDLSYAHPAEPQRGDTEHQHQEAPASSDAVISIMHVDRLLDVPYYSVHLNISVVGRDL